MFSIKHILVCVAAIFLSSQVHAGVLRESPVSGSDSVAAPSSPTVKVPVTTPLYNEATLATTTEVETAEEEEDTTSKVALSRDEHATVILSAVDPITGAFRNVQDAEVLTPESDIKGEAQSAKLFLLSSPKINEKNREFEENVDETNEANSEDLNSGTTESIDIVAEDATTMASSVNTNESREQQSAIEFQTESSVAQKTEHDVFVTRLNRVNESSDAAAAQKDVQPPVDNAAKAILEVDTLDGDYLLLDDHEHFEHLVQFEPLVQSVEFVPARVDEALIVDYTHSW